MAPQLRILTNVIERLKSLKDNVTGHLYGVMHNNTLTVLTFSVNVSDDIAASINHTTLQLNMPAEMYLCGILHVGEQEEKIPDCFQDIDITDNPLFLKYSNDGTEIQSYFYIHQKLEVIPNVQMISENDIQQEFVYIRLQGSLPITAQNDNAMEVLEESRKNVASGRIGIYLPTRKICLFNYDNLGDTSLKELLGMSEVHDRNSKKEIPVPKAIVNPVSATLLLKMSGDKLSEEIKYAPVLQYVRRPFNSLECNLNIDALSIINLNTDPSELHGILVESMCRNIKLIIECLEKQFQATESCAKLPKSVHFKPNTCGHLLTVVYPSGYSDSDTMEYRKNLHQILALDMTKPFFRHGNAVKFYEDFQKNGFLINPHEAIPPNENTTNSNRKIGIVQGLYEYYHYMHDNFNDNHWGCAYRSLQTIVSWYRLQGYTDIPVPSHRAIQKCLVDIGDKSSNFIGSTQWIGSTEVGFVLETLLGVTVMLLRASTGKEVSTFAGRLLHHFHTQGTPVMIGGGVKAHTILGVSYDEATSDVKFLILDPHYTGADHLPSIIDKGFCAWKTEDFWDKDAFYNMCLPQRPACI